MLLRKLACSQFNLEWNLLLICIYNFPQLIGGLADEKDRWSESVTSLNAKLVNIVGDVLVAAGGVAYLGPFTVCGEQLSGDCGIRYIILILGPHHQYCCLQNRNFIFALLTPYNAQTVTKFCTMTGKTLYSNLMNK